MISLPKNLDEKEVLIINRDYFDKRAEKYDEEKVKRVFGLSSQRRMDIVVKYLSSFNNNSFVDVGCGTGNLLKYGHKYFKKSIGYDISSNMVKVAKKKGLNVKICDMNNLKIKDNQIGVVGGSAILHHMFYPDKTLKEICRTVKQGGFLYLDNEPNSFFQESKVWNFYHGIRNIIERKEKKIFIVYNKPVSPNNINKRLLKLGFKPKFYFYWTSNNLFEKENIPLKRKILIFFISLLRMKFGIKYNSPLFSVIAQKSLK